MNEMEDTQDDVPPSSDWIAVELTPEDYVRFTRVMRRLSQRSPSTDRSNFSWETRKSSISTWVWILRSRTSKNNA